MKPRSHNCLTHRMMVLVALLCPTLYDPTDWTVTHRVLCPWNSLNKNTGADCHSLLQGIFLTQGSNPGLLHCRQILYHLSHQQSPYTHRNTTQISMPFNVSIANMHIQLNCLTFEMCDIALCNSNTLTSIW